jgi:hypothetical protein
MRAFKQKEIIMAELAAGAPYREAVTQPLIQSKAAISWAAIIAGAFAATGVTLVLLALGSGLGFASVSPWPNAGVSGKTFVVAAVIWLIVTQWLSAGIGGYIAGRLRTRWIGTHTHEVFFRDTAHGLITWAVATVLVAAVVASSAGAAGNAAADAASSAAASATSPITAYEFDRLMRPSQPGTPSQSAADSKPEVAHIIANAAATDGVSDVDRAYLAQLVAAHAGISQQEAQNRVDSFVSTLMDAESKAKAAADTARQAAAQASIYLALSLLVGAFVASVAAALGGWRRDEHP